MKKVREGCTKCGLCGCWDRPEVNGKEWCEGLPENLFNWYKQHPEDEEKIFTLLRKAMRRGLSVVKVPNIGSFSFVHHLGVGVGSAETDKSCPFLDQSDISCRLWGTDYLPRVCATTPQNLVNEDKIKQWLVDHPKCDFYWVDE